MPWPKSTLCIPTRMIDLLASAFQFTDLGLDSLNNTRPANRFGEKAGISVGGSDKCRLMTRRCNWTDLWTW